MGRSPSLRARVVSTWLSNAFGGICIGRDGPVRWPERSPDISTMFFL